MLQWMKHFFDTNYGGQPYNAKERRDEAKAQYKKGHKHAGTGLKRPVAAPEATEVSPARAAVSKPAARAAPAAAKPVAAAKPRAAAAAKPAAKSSASSADAAALTDQLSKLTLTIEGLEKERNFYFGKLREIEILSQDDEETPVDPEANPDLTDFKKKVLAVLYATDENAEFQVPDEPLPEDEVVEDAGEEGLLGEEELQAE